jgi:hypothetical protein
MTTIGKQDFSGGETIRTRVNVDETAILARCNGYRIEDGRLVPENVASDLTTGTALTGTTPEQTPFAFAADGSTTVIGRDSTTAFREHASGTWGSAGSTLPIVEDNVPCRMGKQIVYSSDGAHPRLMAYEPDSLSTKLRPLSLKSPTDYLPLEKPNVTPLATPAVQLFDIAATTAEWAIADAAFGSVVNTTDKAVITLDAYAPANMLVATRDISGATKALTNKAYLILDIKINTAQEPPYTTDGLFGNDPGLYPSGYLIGLYSDAACTTLIASYRIPRMQDANVNRVAISLGTQTATAQGVGLITDTFFTPPTGTNTYTITLYSGTFEDDWSVCGNWLLPAVQWKHSPWVKKLESMLNVTAGDVVLPASGNLVVDGGFEADPLTTNWDTSGSPDRKTSLQRTGAACVCLEWANDAVQSKAMIAATAGMEYQQEAWYVAPAETGAHAAVWRMAILWYDAGNNLLSTSYFPGPLVTDYYYETHTLTHKRRVGTATAPASTTQCKVRIESEVDTDGDSFHHNFRIDDVSLVAMNKTVSGTATILQTLDESGDSMNPELPRVQYCYCFAGKDSLTNALVYKLMWSNPSDGCGDSDATTPADPWRYYTVAVTLPSGPINTLASAVTAGGSGYAVGDILVINAGHGGKCKVATVSGTAAATVTLISAGSGYATGTGQATANETDATGTLCTVNITDVLTPIEEYGSYLTHILIYRRVYDGETKIWSTPEFVQAVDIGASMSYVDKGWDADAELYGLPVPEYLELTNDYLNSAKHTIFTDRRIYAGCLDWNEELSKWNRPTAIAVSSYDKTHAFPTTVDSESLVTDGVELDGYAQTGSELRGLVVRNDEKYVFLDNEFFLLRGDNPLTGWQFIRIDSVGLKSMRTLVDCRGMLIWHDGHHFYAYQGGRTQNISRFAVDSTLITWTEPYNAVYYNGYYLFYCTYDSVHCVLTFDTESGAWRIRRSDDGLNFVGMCTDGESVYGLTPGGNVFDVYGSSTTEATDAGTQSPTRQVWTQYVRLCEMGLDAQVSDCILLAEASTDIDVTMRVYSHGKQDDDSGDKTYSLVSTATRYADEGMNVKGDAAQTRFEYTGTAPPTIYGLGVEADGVSAR